jgi:hypothetical protein
MYGKILSLSEQNFVIQNKKSSNPLIRIQIIPESIN